MFVGCQPFIQYFSLYLFCCFSRSLSIPRPKDETLNRHSILGPNGLRGQLQLPASDRGVWRIFFVCIFGLVKYDCSPQASDRGEWRMYYYNFGMVKYKFNPCKWEVNEILTLNQDVSVLVLNVFSVESILMHLCNQTLSQCQQHLRDMWCFGRKENSEKNQPPPPSSIPSICPI